MSGLEFVNMANYGMKDKKYTLNLLSFCKHEVIMMMKKMGYMSGIGLGKEGKGIIEFLDFMTQLSREGLRFCGGCDRIMKNLGILNGNFVRKGGGFPFFGFAEPWIDNYGKMVIEEVQEEVDWILKQWRCCLLIP